MEQWLIIQNFFHGLNRAAQEHVDAAAGVSFLSLSVRAANELIEKMTTNQGWKEERSSTRSRGVHHIDNTDMLAAKMDLILKKLGDTLETTPVQALDARMTCAVCGSTGHLGNNCSETRPEDANFINNPNFNNGNRSQPGWSSRPHIPFSGQGNSSSNSQQFDKYNQLDQRAMNDSISKKLHANDRLFETISVQMETFNSAMKNQLSFNKMLET